MTAAIAQIYQDWQTGRLSQDDIERLRASLNFTPETMQGFSYLKPNGYAGCYEIIDRAYRRYHTPNPDLFNWDRYFQRLDASDAVRNRKDYFIRTVLNTVGNRGSASILNVASGPCRDVLDLFDACPNLPIRVHCVEQDPKAIEYASRLCERHLSKISFHEENALRYKTAERFDLVWSAGLFDYLSDRLFVRLAKRLGRFVHSGGELVIGNFSDANPSRPFMELFDWVLHHRSPEELGDLAERAGFAKDSTVIRREPTGVNLFLHISMPFLVLQAVRHTENGLNAHVSVEDTARGI